MSMVSCSDTYIITAWGEDYTVVYDNSLPAAEAVYVKDYERYIKAYMLHHNMNNIDIRYEKMNDENIQFMSMMLLYEGICNTLGVGYREIPGMGVFGKTENTEDFAKIDATTYPEVMKSGLKRFVIMQKEDHNNKMRIKYNGR